MSKRLQFVFLFGPPMNKSFSSLSRFGDPYRLVADYPWHRVSDVRYRQAPHTRSVARLAGVLFGASHVAPTDPLGMLCFLGAAVYMKFFVRLKHP